MEFPQKVIVTDQEIDLTHVTDVQKNHFIDFAKRIQQMYLLNREDRYVVSVSGPSGSGKSVLSAILAELLKEETDFSFYSADLDALHFPNDYLKEHGLLNVKGRYDTYDTESLCDLLRSFTEGKNIHFPRYSRESHEPDPNGPYINSKRAVLFLAGLWFQRNDNSWGTVREYIDYTFSIEGSTGQFQKNTIKRHMRGGRTKENAESFYDNSDLKNAQEISKNSIPSDEVVPYFEDI